MSTDKQNVSRILPEFVVDNLGGSFKVILVDSARCVFDDEIGKERIVIPDYDGLINAAATVRAVHSAKLSGADIRFLRKYLCLKSKVLAEHLDVTAEHLSRCENGEKILSANSEKILRLMVLMKPFKVLQKILEDSKMSNSKTVKLLVAYGKTINDLVSNLKIVPFPSNDDEELVIRFNYQTDPNPQSIPANDACREGEWEHPLLPIAA